LERGWGERIKRSLFVYKFIYTIAVGEGLGDKA